jgi:SAM-dependent methyltransferase
MSDDKTRKNDYGNWVSKKFIYIPAALTIIFMGLTYFSLLFLIGALLFLVPAAYFAYAYRQFSPSGGNLQGRIRGMVLGHLTWNGHGRLLDVGCGNGALAIEAAKLYPGAHITGIDYWGGRWDFSQKACQTNAAVAGVAERTTFERASASKMPFADGSFDAAVSNLVYHEVQDTRDKKEVIREALRVVRRGGSFVFQDLFLVKNIYGEPQDLLATIKSWGVEDVKFLNTSAESFIPLGMKLPFMVGQIGILYGQK